MAVEAAVVFAVLDAAIVSQEWWGALARAKPVANALGVAGKRYGVVSVVFYLARKLPDPRNVFIGVSVDVAVVATVSAVLDAVLVVVTDGPRTGDVGTIEPIEARITLAESIGADAIVGAIPGTVKDAEGPQIVQNERFVSMVKTRSLRFLQVANTAVEKERMVGLADEY